MELIVFFFSFWGMELKTKLEKQDRFSWSEGQVTKNWSGYYNLKNKNSVFVTTTTSGLIHTWICIACYYLLLCKHANIYGHHHEFMNCFLGFLEIKKVDILWNDLSKGSNSYNGSSGELYLRVTMSCDSGSGTFWGTLINLCHKIMPMIDWTRSHPDNIHHFCSAYGIDAGWQYFLHVWFNKFPSFVIGSNWNIWQCVFNVLAMVLRVEFGICNIWYWQVNPS